MTDAELISLAEAIFPQVGDGIYVGCDSRVDMDCPITARLSLRLASHEVRLCRCQNASTTRDIEVAHGRADGGGGIARVTLYLDKVYSLVVVREGGVWLVDDEYCADDPATSIYQDDGPC